MSEFKLQVPETLGNTLKNRSTCFKGAKRHKHQKRVKITFEDLGNCREMCNQKLPAANSVCFMLEMNVRSLPAERGEGSCKSGNQFDSNK